ncbi:Hypothetical_protein [Hexamita inflata]|uniref:Hypothetical_protein n=1 Tax=Hexamita inflata TaxID=28002 RepID=A0ABP1HBV1_9EUKA
MSVLMRRENTLIIEPGSDISKIQIINFILLPNSKKHFEGPPLYRDQTFKRSEKMFTDQKFTDIIRNTNIQYKVCKCPKNVLQYMSFYGGYGTLIPSELRTARVLSLASGLT